jgi:hypothetical protein
MTNLRILMLALSVCSFGGCTIEKIADGGPALTRSVKVPAREVAIYTSASDVPARYTVIEDVWVKDDHETLPKELERDLREIAGARGANAVILASTNRKLNGTRVDWHVRLDNPFNYYAGTAVWIGERSPPVTVLRQ